MMYSIRYRCVKCRGYLNNHLIMYSSGTCPLCGNHKPGTIVDHTVEVGIWKRVPGWRGWLLRQRRWVPKSLTELGGG